MKTGYLYSIEKVRENNRFLEPFFYSLFDLLKANNTVGIALSAPINNQSFNGKLVVWKIGCNGSQ